MNENHHRARKRFGQNFLQDQAVIDRIISAILRGKKSEPGRTDTNREKQHFVEIGPGQGALSYPFIDSIASDTNAQLTLLEIDRDLAARLHTKLDGKENVALIETDALKYDFIELAEQSNTNTLTVFGNLPYNISTPLIFHLLNQQNQFTQLKAGNPAGKPLFSSMIFMLQKEVVDRICAQPNTKAYGRISIMTQLQCQCEKLFDVPPSAFKPAPKVTSSIIQITPCEKKFPAVKDHSLFAQVVKQSFAQRRKTLRNNLGKLVSAEELTSIDIDPGRRAETLLIEDYIRIANYLSDR